MIPSMPPGLDLVAHRPLRVAPVDVTFRLRPGDRSLVASGESLTPGMPLVERVRDAQLATFEAPADVALRPGDRWPLEGGHQAIGEIELSGAGGARARVVGAHTRADDARARRRSFGRQRPEGPAGELLFESGARWRLATGEFGEPIESPIAGIVRHVRPGVGIVVRATGGLLPGAFVLGGSSRGRVEIATDADGEIRPGALDVGASGTILVVGSRVDAETITRARAMGVRGLVVGGLSGKERRDFDASERRQRAAIHRVPPFAVLVLDGAIRRAIPEPVMAVLEAISGREVGLIDDPPGLVIDDADVDLPEPPADRVRVRSGPLAGRTGRWCGLAGIRRFAAGTHLEAALVQFADESPVALPLADLERWG